MLHGRAKELALIETEHHAKVIKKRLAAESLLELNSFRNYSPILFSSLYFIMLHEYLLVWYLSSQPVHNVCIAIHFFTVGFC